MPGPPSSTLLFLVLVAILGVGAVAAGYRLRPARPSRRITLIATLPALVMFVLFYSLAIHMYQSLGGWPDSIGTHGFPSSLNLHADVAGFYFTVFFILTIFVWPVALMLCASIPRWRGAIFYLGVYALSCLLFFVSMKIAPARFTYWWWD